MAVYVFYKKNKNGLRAYLTEGGDFTVSRQQAKKYDIRFWIELLNIVIQILSIFGVRTKWEKIR